MRLIILSVVGFFSMLAGTIAMGLLVSVLHLPESLVVPVVMGGGFGVAILVVLAVAKRLESKEAPRPGLTLLGLTIPEDTYPDEPAGDGAPAQGAGSTGRPLCDEIRRELAQERPPTKPAWWLTLLLGGLFAVCAGVDSVQEALALVGVVLVHELGHFVAMRAVGYRDVRIFFVPFFGAVTTGRGLDRPVAPWQRVVVSLAGPVPGLMAVFVCVLTGRPEGFWREVLSMALMLNLINLMPFEPLDGGRVVVDLLSSRSWRLEVTFAALSCLALGAFGWWSSSTMFYVISGVGLSMLPRRKRVRAMVTDLRSRWLTTVSAPGELPDEALTGLVSALNPMLPPTARQPARYASEIRALWEEASRLPASWPATIALLSVYALCLLGSLVTLVAWTLRH